MSDIKYRMGVTRRGLIAASTVATAGVLLQGRGSDLFAQTGPRNTMQIPGSDELVASAMPGSFSMAEIQRRWTKCRDWMRRAGFDALVVPTVPEGNADIKWLTEGIPDWVVFPQQGRPTAIFRTGDEDSNFEALMQDHLDIRASLLNRSDLIIESLKDAGVSNGRIGIGNLTGTLRYDEGGASYTTVDRLKKAFPNARFDSAADLLMRVKLSRGQEEIEALRLSNRIGELGIKAAVENSAPGVLQRDVWFQIAKAYLDASGESPGRITIRAGAEGNTADGKPLNEVIQGGQILSMTLSASVLGYNCQVNQTICIGQPAPTNWESTCQYNIELFETLVDGAKPGRSIADYVSFYKQEVDKRIAAFGGKPYTGVVFHTGGALGDGPRMGWQRDDENLDLVIEPGMVFTIKPRVPIPGLPTPSTQIGDGVVITATGAERLGRRKLEPITLS